MSRFLKCFSGLAHFDLWLSCILKASVYMEKGRCGLVFVFGALRVPESCRG